MSFETSVSSEVMDLSDLFPLEAQTKEVSKTLFTKDSDTIVIDDEEDDDKGSDTSSIKPPLAVAIPGEKPVITIPPVIEEGKLSLDDLDAATEDFEEAKQGTKSGLREFFKAKIEAGEITAFSDFDDKTQTLDQYLKGFKTKDFDELWKANAEQKEKDLSEKVPQQFFESLPAEMQYAAKYIADGGTDYKGLFKALAQVEEVKALDPVKDARALCESYLAAKDFGTSEQIKEQIDEWDDLGVLAKKSAGFKPQLDKMQDTIVQQKLKIQEDIKANQVAEGEYFHNNVVEALKTEDLTGIKLDKKTQISLYKGLTDPSYVDSRGNRCTEFQHLLDKITWKEPNYKLLAKIQWMLKDETGYDKAVASKAINTNIEDTVRTLKTEQAKSRSAIVEQAAPKPILIPRGSRMFKR